MPLTGGFSQAGASAADVWAEATRTLTSATALALTFDNARLSITASQTDDTVPATGESDSGQIETVTAFSTSDDFETSPNSGTNFHPWLSFQGTAIRITENANSQGTIIGIGNSTGRYRITTDATAGTRIFHQLITTVS